MSTPDNDKHLLESRSLPAQSYHDKQDDQYTISERNNQARRSSNIQVCDSDLLSTFNQRDRQFSFGQRQFQRNDQSSPISQVHENTRTTPFEIPSDIINQIQNLVLQKIEQEIESKINLAIGARLKDVFDIQKSLSDKIQQLEKNQIKGSPVVIDKKRNLVIKPVEVQRKDSLVLHAQKSEKKVNSTNRVSLFRDHSQQKLQSSMLIQNQIDTSDYQIMSSSSLEKQEGHLMTPKPAMDKKKSLSIKTLQKNSSLTSKKEGLEIRDLEITDIKNKQMSMGVAELPGDMEVITPSQTPTANFDYTPESSSIKKKMTMVEALDLRKSRLTRQIIPIKVGPLNKNIKEDKKPDKPELSKKAQVKFDIDQIRSSVNQSEQSKQSSAFMNSKISVADASSKSQSRSLTRFSLKKKFKRQKTYHIELQAERIRRNQEKAQILKNMSLKKQNLIEKMSNIGEDAVIDLVIDELWEIYDDDKNGMLDIDETRNFVKESLATMCQTHCFHE